MKLLRYAQLWALTFSVHKKYFRMRHYVWLQVSGKARTENWRLEILSAAFPGFASDKEPSNSDTLPGKVITVPIQTNYHSARQRTRLHKRLTILLNINHIVIVDQFTQTIYRITFSSLYCTNIYHVTLIHHISTTYRITRNLDYYTNINQLSQTDYHITRNYHFTRIHQVTTITRLRNSPYCSQLHANIQLCK